MNTAELYTTIDSPVGKLLLVGDGSALSRLAFQTGRHPVAIEPRWERRDGAFETVTRQLTEYFDGERRAFDVPLELAGNSFEQRVAALTC